MLESVALAFIIAKIKGYKLKPIFKEWQSYIALTFVLAYIFLQTTVFFGNYRFIRYSKIFETLYLSSFIFLILRCRLYGSAIIGSVFITIGSILNKIVIYANNGKMPVFPNISYITGYVNNTTFTGIDNIHILGNEFTKLKFLADIFDVGYSVMSIGDIFIRVFSFLILYNSIKYLNTTQYRVSYN